MKNSYQHIYPNMEVLNANFPRHFVYKETDLRDVPKGESPNSSMDTLNSGQLKNVIHSSIFNENQTTPQHQPFKTQATISHNSYQPGTLLGQQPIIPIKNKILSNVSKTEEDLTAEYSQIDGKESGLFQYSLSESDDDSFMNLVYNMKESQDKDKRSTVNVKSINLTSAQLLNYETKNNDNTLPLNIKDPAKDLLTPIQIHNIQSCVDEESCQNSDVFYSFSESKRYSNIPGQYKFYLNDSQDRARKELIQETIPLTERIDQRLPLNPPRGSPMQSNQMIMERNDTSESSKSSRIRAKFRISQAELSKLLKKNSSNRSSSKKNVGISLLNDTVPDTNEREQIEIMKINPIFQENFKFLSGNTSRSSRYLTLPSNTEPQEAYGRALGHRRYNTMNDPLPTDNFVLCVNCNDLIATDQIDRHSMVCYEKSHTQREEIQLEEPIPSTKIVDCNTKLTKLHKNLKINVEKLEVAISDYSLDNEDLINAYLELACERVEEIIANNTSIAKLHLDIDSLKNVKEYLYPTIRIPMISLVISNLEMICLIAADKESNMERIRDNSTSFNSKQRIKKANNVPNLRLGGAKTMTQEELNTLLPKDRMQYAASVLSPSQYNNPRGGFLSDTRQNKRSLDWGNYRVNSEDQEYLKSSFCALATEYKNLLPANHPGKNKDVGELYNDVIEKNIPETSWNRYLIEKFNKAADGTLLSGSKSYKKGFQ